MVRIAVLAAVIAASGGIAADEQDVAAKIEHARKELNSSRITVQGEPAAGEFLAIVAKQTGNAVVDRRTVKSSVKQPVVFDKTPFWPALDKFCALAGCSYTAYGSDGGIALIDGTRRSPHVSYHGITRTAVKHLNVGSDLESDIRTCVIHLDVAWEPRFEPFYLGVGPATATYEPRGAAKELKVQAPARGQLPVAGRSACEIEIVLPAAPRSSPAIEALEGSVKLIGPSKMLNFRFAGPKEGAAQDQEEVSVRLTKVKEGLDRWIVEVQIDNPEGTPAFESFQTWLDNNRISLVKGEGGKARPWLPEPNETVLVETNRKAIIQYAFADPKGKGKLADWTLAYRTPGRIVEWTAPYRFKNVPLP